MSLARTFSALLGGAAFAALGVAQAHAGSTRFVENLGQWPSDVRFAADIAGVVARAECGGLGFHGVETDGRATYVRLVFEEVADRVEPEGLDLLPGLHHHFVGNDPGLWRPNARAYAAVVYRGLYPGVDLVLRAEGASPKYDLILAPGVDPAVIRARWIGADSTLVQGSGLTLGVGGAAVHELPVVAWQSRSDGSRRRVSARWATDGQGVLRVETSSLDPALPLTIDPEIVWGTYIAAGPVPAVSTEGVWILRAGPDDSTLAVGRSTSHTFPTTPGAVHLTPLGGDYIHVARFARDGTTIYVAMLGGSTQPDFPLPAYQRANGAALDSHGRALVVGGTGADDFPTTPGALDRVRHNGTAGFAFRLSSDGSALEFSTLLDGNTVTGHSSSTTACHAYDDGRALVAGGLSGTPDFPTTLPPIGTVPPPGPPWPDFSAGYVTCLDSTGSTVLWSRLIGDFSDVRLLAVARAGEVDLVGKVRWSTFPTTPGAFMPVKPHPTNTILFAMQLSADGTNLNWSTFLGTAGSGESTLPSALSLDDFGVLTFLFTTNRRDFPTTPDSFMPTPPPSAGSFFGGGFVRMASDGSHLVGSTYTGAGGGYGLGAPTVDRSGVVTGFGDAGSQFQATPGAADPTFDAGEVQIGRFDPRVRRLLHLRHFGGSRTKFAQAASVHADRSVAVGGTVLAPGDMPTTAGAFQTDWPGAYAGGFAFRLHLTVNGVEHSGDGTPACHGPIVTEAWRSPQSGASDFGLYASGAPANAVGALFIGRLSSQPSTFGGAAWHLDPASGFRALRVRTDEFGYVETPLAVPALPSGTQFAVQYVFRNPPDCASGTAFSTSNALRLIVR